MPIICGPVGKCKNCDHYIFLKSDGSIEHFTRAYHDHGYPYTSKKCFAVFNDNKTSCNCQNPELNYDLLSRGEIEIINQVQSRKD